MFHFVGEFVSAIFLIVLFSKKTTNAANIPQQFNNFDNSIASPYYYQPPFDQNQLIQQGEFQAPAEYCNDNSWKKLASRKKWHPVRLPSASKHYYYPSPPIIISASGGGPRHRHLSPIASIISAFVSTIFPSDY